jgi:hypothetical protein
LLQNPPLCSGTENIDLAKNHFKKYANIPCFFFTKIGNFRSPTLKSWQQWHGRGAQWRWT